MNIPEAEVTLVPVWELIHAARVVEARLEAALAEHGLSIARFGVLDTLAQAAEPMTLSELAEQQSCVRSNITQLVDRLENDGLVQRVADSVDRRSIRATLTPLGTRRQAEGAAACRQVQMAVSVRVPEGDRVAFSRVLVACPRNEVQPEC